MTRATSERTNPRVPLKPLWLVLGYAAVAGLWILVTDQVMDVLFRDAPELWARASLFKGFFFVLVTAALLHFLLHRQRLAFRRKEQELGESRRRYQLVVENAPDAIMIHQGRTLVFANAEAAKLFGAASVDALIGRDLLDFVHEDSREAALARMRQTIGQRQRVRLREQRYLRLDGSSIEVEVAGVPFPGGGEPAALLFLHDIGERKAAEQRLRESEAKYRLLADNSHDVIFIMDAAFRLTFVSPSVRRLRGVSVEEALAETFEESMTPTSAALAREASKQFLAPEPELRPSSQRLELELRRKDGSTVWVEAVVRALSGPSGEFTGVLGVGRDITERRRAEEDLRRSREFQAMILEAIPDPVFVKDSRHRFVQVNGALCAMLGQPPEAIIGKSDYDFVPTDEADVFVSRDKWVFETGQEDLYEERLTDPLGQVHVLVTRKGLFIDASGARFIVGVIRDVTEDKAKEQRLRDSLLEKEVLLKEVHHRVKNNLQVISSLLFLQKDTIEDPAIQVLFEESRNRVASMALIHEELYRSGDLARVDLKEYLERLTPKVVQSLRGDKSIGFALDLAECRVPVDKAIPFGLIVNELVTNAVKHAFVGRDAGTIRVTVERERDVVRASVEDDGVGLEKDFHPDAVKSLGMQLVVQLTHQLRGALTFGGTGGAAFRLVFPLSDAAS